MLPCIWIPAKCPFKQIRNVQVLNQMREHCMLCCTQSRIHPLRFTKIVCSELQKEGKGENISFFPFTQDYMCLTSRQSSPCACLLEICEVTGHMVHTGQLFSTEWNDWLRHNCPRQESSLTKDLHCEKGTCILHGLGLKKKQFLKKKIKDRCFTERNYLFFMHLHPAAAKLTFWGWINCKWDIITSLLIYCIAVFFGCDNSPSD